MLIVGRAISGIGSSGIQNGALTIVASAVPIHKRPSLIGIIMGFAQLGIVTGPLVGGAFTQYTTWRWCKFSDSSLYLYRFMSNRRSGFYINLPIGAICAVLILLVQVPNHRAPTDETIMQLLKTKFDFTGLAMFSPSVVMILLALQWGGVEYAWNSATTIGLFCGGGVLFAIFIFWEHRVGADAMIPMPIVRTRQVWTAMLTQLFLFATVMVASFYLPIYFQSAKDASPFTSGVNLLPSILMLIVAAVSSGALGKLPVVDLGISLLTVNSSETWLLFTVRISQCSFLGYWFRSLINHGSLYFHSQMGGLSNLDRFRTRTWSSDAHHSCPGQH